MSGPAARRFGQRPYGVTTYSASSASPFNGLALRRLRGVEGSV